MCICVIALKRHPSYPFILVHNRDEERSRSSRAMQYWPDEGVIAGKDDKAGGTWLAANLAGEFSLVTNHRDKNALVSQKKSRGHLPLRSLKDKDSLRGYLETKGESYNPFHLLWGDQHRVHYYSNTTQEFCSFDEGIVALSNTSLNQEWFKTERAKLQIEKLIKDDEFSVFDLIEVFKDETKAPQEKLPQTGVSHEVELFLSSIFLDSETYGTRTTTVILIDNDNQMRLIEVGHHHKKKSTSHRELVFEIG